MNIVRLSDSILVLKGSPNTGIVIDRELKRASIIDPGIGENRGSEILEVITSEDLENAVIVFTHGHTDHIAAAKYLIEKGLGPIYAPRPCTPLIEDSAVRRAIVYGGLVSANFASMPMIELHVNYTYSHGNPIPVHLSALSLPGHSPGHSGLRNDTEKVVFIGDAALGERVLDRFGVPFGINLKKMLESIILLKELVKKGYTLIPGHGPIVSGERALQLLEANEKAILAAKEFVLNALKEKPLTLEALAVTVTEQLSKSNITPRQIALNKTAISSILAWLEEEGRVKPRVAASGVIWEALLEN